MKERITHDMTTKEAVIAMCEGNPGALKVLLTLLRESNGLIDMLRLDYLGIYGPRIWILSKYCCMHNSARINRTLELLFYGVLTEEQIYENLDRAQKGLQVLPFIDDTIKIKGVPDYGREFNSLHPRWHEWVKAQKASFERRIQEV